jgi:multisubunit Na+/H+ antiporter MnhG subunit
LGLAAMTSVASALVFDYFRNWPGKVVPAEGETCAAIVILLVVVLVANAVASLARARAAEAEQRRREAEASRDELRVLAEQQAALRQVATLVAHRRQSL